MAWPLRTRRPGRPLYLRPERLDPVGRLKYPTCAEQHVKDEFSPCAYVSCYGTGWTFDKRCPVFWNSADFRQEIIVCPWCKAKACRDTRFSRNGARAVYSRVVNLPGDTPQAPITVG